LEVKEHALRIASGKDGKMTTTSGATEFSLAYSNQGGAAVLQGSFADARQIQTVLLGHARAGDNDFGLAVRQYLMEISDPATVDTISDLASELVGRYCPGVTVNALVTQLISAQESPAGRGTNSLVIGVSLGNPGVTNTFPFALLVGQGGNGVVESSLIF
jgi:hypothetical protein